MPKKILKPASLSFFPSPEYPYSPGTKNGRLVYTAGQVAFNEKAELVGIGDVAAQTRQTLRNVLAILAEGGAGPEDVLKCNVYLSDMRFFADMNAEFQAVFGDETPPARTTVEARLATAEMLVEIEAIACVDE